MQRTVINAGIGLGSAALSAAARISPGTAIGFGALATTGALFAATVGRFDIAQGLAAGAAGITLGSLVREFVGGSGIAMPITQLVTLRNAAYPSQSRPNTLVHVPAGFDPSRSFDLLFYMRGWNSCIEAIAAPSKMPCRPQGRERQNSDIIGQVDRSGNKQIVLIMPEWLIEDDSSGPGALARRGAFRALAEEVLADVVSPAAGASVGLTGVRRTLIAAHSGGYSPTIAAIDDGDLPRVTDVLLLDALYGGDQTFIRFVRGGGKLVTIFTGGVTERRSRAVAAETGGAVDDSTGPLTPDQWRSRMLAKKTSLAHPLIPLRNLQAWLESR